MIDYELLKEAVDAVIKFVTDFVNSIRKLFKKVKKAVMEIANIYTEKAERSEREKRHRSTWMTHKDTRRHSQVVNRKPRNLVKRIIR